MTKLLALLFAFLLPACAMADTYAVTIDIDSNADALSAHAAELLKEVPGINKTDLDAYARAFSYVLDGASAEVLFQSDAAMFTLNLSEGFLMDFTAQMLEHGIQVSSSLLPGYAFVLEDPASEALQNKVTCGQATMKSWFTTNEPLVSYGTFHGDAFEGGSQRRFWHTDSKDLGCTISLITDDQNQLIGASVTVISDNEQIGTASLGVHDDGFKLVIGVGLSKENYWWEFTASTKRRENITFLSGTSCEWMADKMDGYSYVRNQAMPVSSFEWQCNVTESGDRRLWDAVIYEVGETERSTFLTSRGSVVPSRMMAEGSMTLGSSSASPLKINLSLAPANGTVPASRVSKLCYVNNPDDQDLLARLSQDSMINLVSQLAKLVPMDVLLTLSDLFSAN